MRSRVRRWRADLDELHHALRRVAQTYKHIDRLQEMPARTFEVEVALFPMTREDGDRFLACLVKNERIEALSKRRDEALRKQRICRLSVQVTNQPCADAAVAILTEAISEALLDANIVLDGMFIESMLPDEPFTPEGVIE